MLCIHDILASYPHSCILYSGKSLHIHNLAKFTTFTLHEMFSPKWYKVQTYEQNHKTLTAKSLILDKIVKITPEKFSAIGYIDVCRNYTLYNI